MVAAADFQRVDQGAVPLARLWRGGLPESAHLGHLVIADRAGIIEARGNPGAIIFPRSSCKMIQALPLLESGAAARAGLRSRHLALSCASHEGAALHVGAVSRWLKDLGLGEQDLRCGAHEPAERSERNRLIRAEEAPCQLHNNCSGKHAGFLTVTQHLRAGPEYGEYDHPLQQAIRQATAEVTEEEPAGWGVDGCSAPNFAMSLQGLARGMASFAAARQGEGGVRGDAMARLVQAMIAHPELVAGEGRACTGLMRAARGRAAVKVGAEGVFVAIIPDQGIGIALKCVDGNARAAEVALTAVLIRLGVIAAGEPLAQKWCDPVQRSWRGIEAGVLQSDPALHLPPGRAAVGA